MPTIAPTPQVPYSALTHLDSEGTYSQPIFASQWTTSLNAFISQSHDLSSQPHQDDNISNPPTADIYHTSRLATIGNGQPQSHLPVSSVSSNFSEPSALTSHDEPTSLNYDAFAQSSTSSSSKAAPNSKDDKPFMFDPEYITATAVMFQQEVLPAFPEYAQLDSYRPLTKCGNGA
jgi:hypothetical protein